MWDLKDQSATLKHPGISLEVCPAQPAQGTKVQMPGSAGKSVSCFCVSAVKAQNQSWNLQESFVRGSDLVASYAPWPGDAVEPHIYWRFRDAHHGTVAGLELIVSVHTSLLDSRPAIEVSGELIGEVCQHGLPGGVFCLTPSHEKDKQLLFWIHPADFAELSIHREGEGSKATWTTTLFSEASLEKGVIRRARLGVWVIPAGLSSEAKIALYHEIVHEAPPLTA